jgi:hypothetical protein
MTHAAKLSEVERTLAAMRAEAEARATRPFTALDHELAEEDGVTVQEARSRQIGRSVQAQMMLEAKAAELRALLTNAALTLRAEADDDLRDFSARRADAAARICAADALEAWSRGDDAAARDAMRNAAGLMGDAA